MATSITPTPGRIVLVKLRQMGKSIYINGSDEHPAIVCSVHSKNMVNVRVFQDDHEPPRWETSVAFEDTVEKDYSSSTWRWPTRS